MKWTNSYRSFGLKTKRSTGLKTIEHKHSTAGPGTARQGACPRHCRRSGSSGWRSGCPPWTPRAGRSTSTRPGHRKKGGSRSVGVSRGGRNAKVHVASDGESTVVEIHVSPGDEHDAAHGRRSMAALGASVGAHPLMGRAYERDSTRLPAESFGLTPVVIPRGTVRPHGITTGRRTRGGTWSNASSTA